MIRFGLLSTARINGAILDARGPDAPFEVVAVGSRDAARAEAYASEHGIARAHGSYDDLLADDGVDAVYIALPNALHHEWTMRALEAGKHALVEKPYTRFPEQVDEAWDEAERRGLVLEEAYMWRHAAQTRLLVDLVPRVGEIRSVHSTFTGWLSRDDDVRWDAGLGGGALLDVGCYCVSALRLLLGEPDAAHGAARMRDGVDAGFAGVLRFGEVTATFQCALDASTVNRIEVIGADGVLRVADAFVDPPGLVELNGEPHRVEPGNHYRAELEDVCAAIRGERSVLLGREEMRGQAQALATLLASASSRG
ncbi:MAG: Gfo/Idh/MocA family protein [Gaiellaceae bacterium]